jgi:predicted CoA-binding protein
LMKQEEVIEHILGESKTIAVVGLSPDPDRPSNRVAGYLQSQGYRIIPVNPAVEEVLGQRSYPDLASVPGEVDVVDIFRRPEHVPAIVEAAIAKGAKAIWMQEGIVHQEAAAEARAAGLQVVMDRCMFKEHQRLKAAGGLD